jgi:acyl carrier protein
MSIEATIKDYILNNLLAESGRTEMGLDESLISSGVLDSMILLQLVAFIEDQFGITVEDEELIPDNFETINHMVTLVERKRPAR